MATDRYWRDVYTIGAQRSIYEAAETMAREGVGCIVVVDQDQRAVGVLTDRDLTLRVVARPAGSDAPCIGDVMSQPPVVVGLDDPVAVAIRRMKRRGIRRIPVVDAEGRPIGLVAFDDLLYTLSQELLDLSEEARPRGSTAPESLRETP